MACGLGLGGNKLVDDNISTIYCVKTPQNFDHLLC